MRKLIPHTSGKPFFQVRLDLIEICEGGICPAALLGLFEFWANGSPIKDPEEIWIERSLAELNEALLGLRGERRIADALKYLIECGYLSRSAVIGHASTYRLNVAAVLTALNGTPAESTTPADVRGTPADVPRVPTQNCGGHSIKEVDLEEPLRNGGASEPPTHPGNLYFELVRKYPAGHNPTPQLALQNFISRCVEDASIGQQMIDSLSQNGWSDAWQGGRFTPDLQNWIRDWHPDAQVAAQKRTRTHSAMDELADL